MSVRHRDGRLNWTDPARRDAQPDNAAAQIRLSAAQHIRAITDALWLGYVAWAYRGWRAGRVDGAILAKALEVASEYFARHADGPYEVVRACSVLVEEDPIGWELISSYEESAEARRHGRMATARYVDPWDGNAEALALVGLRIGLRGPIAETTVGQMLNEAKPQTRRLLDLNAEQREALEQLGVVPPREQIDEFIEAL